MSETITPQFHPHKIATLDGVLVGNFEPTADKIAVEEKRLPPLERPTEIGGS